MKIYKVFLVCVLTTGLCVAGSAQAFCFLKGKNSARGMNHYLYQLPPIDYVPIRYSTHPYSALPVNAGQVQPNYIAVPLKDSLLIRGQGIR